AVACLKAAGVKAIIARSFARIYYRNAINLGLPAIEIEDVDRFDKEDEVEVDLERGVIKNLTKNFEVTFSPFPPYVMEILNAGGLLEYVKRRLRE
ncbi:MAG: 3-isopropylmalate dehydratase, partial [Thermoplasmata archaeon]